MRGSGENNWEGLTGGPIGLNIPIPFPATPARTSENIFLYLINNGGAGGLTSF